jgi:hypothetical protein
MFSTLISKRSQPELPYAPESLKFRRIHQTDKQFARSSVVAEANNIVHWIAINSFAQKICCDNYLT